MKCYFAIVVAEIKKYRSINFHSWMTFFSLLIWPAIIFYNTYYTYLSFDTGSLSSYGISTQDDLMIFLITGAMGLNFFFSMVQSAWEMSYERNSGTLEVTFLSPINKLFILYARALGSLIENVWMFSVFAVMIVIFKSSMAIEFLFSFIISFLLLFVSSAVWGGLMNAVFLFSRDASFLFNLLDAPMDLFSGVRLPVESFPFWAQCISSVFPLTYCLKIMRNMMNKGIGEFDVLCFWKLLVVLAIMVTVTVVIEKLAEQNAMKTGNYNFY